MLRRTLKRRAEPPTNNDDDIHKVMQQPNAMSGHSRDVHQSVEKSFQTDTLEEFELLDQSYFSHIDDIMSKLGILEENQPSVSSS
ncbi:hypothetical protein PoB_007068600 [Plakobranchus ocellatus]|uniref:Uncharacterized protein n=1 Tax=Plakobranchus ocellatus TaxID=259542 RepID=A0AAV4DJ45_9GAST|nr:hypothetical protein PoB_007068600 [Plakobranchus ocellatus]